MFMSECMHVCIYVCNCTYACLYVYDINVCVHACLLMCVCLGGEPFSRLECNKVDVNILTV